ncbi:heavy metal translocating P-type ATPase [Rhodococcus sp. RD6.2]|uniref:heavy metal translocating P-type ATPase n=1 Tax=Rhodococcus sp. RD6.2 TaxID=260936 RepID=UPI0006787DFB|nr:heavy metal translocating P-type ATPase [Rhodococcus sp. RD6.2]
MVEPALLVTTATALVAGGVAWIADEPGVADLCWAIGTVAAIVPSAWWVARSLRHKQIGVDLISVLSLVGTLLVGEYLAGALVAVMVGTGRSLDAAASRRASKDLHSLVDRAPRTSRRRVGDDVEVVPIDEIAVGDTLVVGPGETVPVDGWVTRGDATLDESALTGESLHVLHHPGAAVRSGVVNAADVFEMEAAATAEDSTYAGVVRLARDAAAESAPVVRLADQVAAWFVPVALALALAAWALSGTAERAVAVLVVATPCPLLLAAPVAIVSGLSRASRIGVVIRSGGALENLGHARTLVMDKTGTLTTGRPAGTDVVAAPGVDTAEILRLAASADQVSPHVLAAALVQEARTRSLPLSYPSRVVEEAGTGVTATVDGHRVTVGARQIPDDAPQWARGVVTRSALDGGVVVWVTVDGDLAGAVQFVDPLRRDAPRTLRRLRSAGLDRLVMLTGDRREPAEEIGTVLGLDLVCAQQTPSDKVAGVRRECESAVTVMVGDGINDAPALAAATVGVAMGARGSTASSEAADVVLTTDRLDRLADAMEIARRSRRIAVESAVVGMGLSLLAMAFAAAGLLAPAVGALLQEVIDVAVILNALRAMGGGGTGDRGIPASTDEMLHRFSAEHDAMRDRLGVLRDTAQLVAAGDDPHRTALLLRRADDFLVDTLLPHEQAEETQLYPALASPLGSSEATATMSRMHAEIARLGRRLHTHRCRMEEDDELDPARSEDLLACLYGLHALLRLHFVQEEENYFVLSGINDSPDVRGAADEE